MFFVYHNYDTKHTNNNVYVRRQQRPNMPVCLRLLAVRKCAHAQPSSVCCQTYQPRVNVREGCMWVCNFMFIRMWLLTNSASDIHTIPYVRCMEFTFEETKVGTKLRSNCIPVKSTDLVGNLPILDMSTDLPIGFSV